MGITKSESGDANAIATAQHFGWTDWLFAVVVVAAVFLAYARCWNGGFLLDDDLHLLNNPVLAPGGLAKIWVPGGSINYWPLTFTVYWLEFHLWSLEPLCYHLVNLTVHALSALLVWRVLGRLRVPGAMFAAALFALHPVNVETVAWVSQLKGILSVSLALVSVLFYLSNEQHESRWRYCAGIVAFLLSALAKGMALTLPIVLLACAWWQRGRIERRDVLRILPYVLVAAVMAGIEVWAQRYLVHGEVVRSDGFLSRAAVAGCALWFYVGKLIWPTDLCPIYPRWTIDAPSIVSYLPSLLWVVLLAFAWRRRNTWGRGMVMLVVGYLALLLPALGFVNISFMRYSLVSDHWQYFAMIVPCAGFAGLAAAFARKRSYRLAVSLAGAALLTMLAIMSWRQSRMYSDAETFYETIIVRNPDCWLADNNLGNLLTARGRIASAIPHFHRALEIKPDYAEAHYNLAVALTDSGQIELAIPHFLKAIEIKPDYAEAHNNLAVALVARGQMDSAIAHYKRALAINPGFAAAHYDFAVALAQSGNVDSAVEHYRKALEIDPNLAGAHINLGNLLAGRGDLDSAIVHFQRAIEIAPENKMARRNLADVRAEQERIRKAEPRKPRQSPPNAG